MKDEEMMKDGELIVDDFLKDLQEMADLLKQE